MGDPESTYFRRSACPTLYLMIPLQVSPSHPLTCPAAATLWAPVPRGLFHFPVCFTRTEVKKLLLWKLPHASSYSILLRGHTPHTGIKDRTQK